VLLQADAQSRAAPVHVALRRAHGHPGDARDVLVREPERVAEDNHRSLVGGELSQALGELSAQVGQEGRARGVEVVARRLVLEIERLSRPHALAVLKVVAGVHDEPVEPGGKLRFTAKLAQARAELDERLLRSVASVLHVADEVSGEAVDARRVPLDEHIERGPVPRARLRDKREITEPPVGLEQRHGDALFAQTDRGRYRLHGGVSLVPMGSAEASVQDSLAPEEVEPLLRGGFGKPYIYEERCESTQKLLDRSLDEGAIAACDEQTEGRGRLGRSWAAPAGTAVLCSVLLRPPAERRTAELSLVGGLAAALSVERALGLTSQIKWPNDVMVNRRKVAGVLAETADDVVVLGIGINVNQRRDQLPVETAVPPASLLTTDGVKRVRAPLLADLLGEVERTYKLWTVGGLEGLYDELGSRDFLRNRKVFLDGETGYAIAIDRCGRLEVDIGGNRRVVEGGEVLYER
jgi:BirA family transcriptional regulator, biotin operon repressor / biotin---[acetyl-CoA-carboxylase] ligase